MLVADETIYCYGAEQLSVCLRFVKDGKIYERLYSAVVGSLHQLSQSRDGKVVRRAISYFKAITAPGFLVSLEVINAILNITKLVAKKLQGIS